MNSLTALASYTPPRDASVGAKTTASHAGVATEKTGTSIKDHADSAAKTGKDVIELNTYLSIISKLENSITQKTLGDKELTDILRKLQSRMETLDKKVLDKLSRTDAFKKLHLTNIKNLQQELKVMLDDPKDRQAVFAFLKSKAFIASLKGEPWPQEIVYVRPALNKSATPDAAVSKPPLPPAEEIKTEQRRSA